MSPILLCYFSKVQIQWVSVRESPKHQLDYVFSSQKWNIKTTRLKLITFTHKFEDSIFISDFYRGFSLLSVTNSPEFSWTLQIIPLLNFFIVFLAISTACSIRILFSSCRNLQEASSHEINCFLEDRNNSKKKKPLIVKHGLIEETFLRVEIVAKQVTKNYCFWTIIPNWTVIRFQRQSLSPIRRCFWALWRGKVSALVLQVLATQACGIKLAFSKCLLQCLHCTDEAHILNRPKQTQPVCSNSIPINTTHV